MKRKDVLRTGYKIAGILLVLYALVVGMTITLPDLKPLMQSSRNIFFHVPMWFATITLMSISLFHSVRLTSRI